MPEGTTPAGEASQAPQTEAPTTTPNEQSAPTTTPNEQSAPAPVPAPAPDMHGFTSEQLADMQRFFAANGGFDAVKSKISNPTPAPAQPQAQQAPEQPVQPQQPAQPQERQPLPKGYASMEELNVERYFRDLSARPEYSSISEQIANGDVLKEMASMGMTPIDENYNINVQQLNQFLALKAASVPTKPTTAEPTNIPTVDYVEVGDEIKDANQALAVLQQSIEAKAKGAAPHPAEMKAKEFLQKNSTWK